MLKTTASTVAYVATNLSLHRHIGLGSGTYELSVDELDVCRDVIRSHVAFNHHLSRENGANATNSFHI